MSDPTSRSSKDALKRIVEGLSPGELEALDRYYRLKQSAAEISRALGFTPDELRELRSRVKQEFLTAQRKRTNGS